MLAQSFKSAADLGITEPQLSALQKTLVLLETGKLVHADVVSSAENRSFAGYFNMQCWMAATHDCGTVACIGGTAEIIGGLKRLSLAMHPSPRLQDLFLPEMAGVELTDITTSQAATALRSYLTTGDARWDLAVGEPRAAAQHGGT